MTKRQDKRDERKWAKLGRARLRRTKEANRERCRRNLPFKRAAGAKGERWMPIPDTEYECNQFGNVRKKAGTP